MTTHVNKGKVESRKAGRAIAQEILQLINTDVTIQENRDAREALWECLRQRAEQECPLPPADAIERPMSDTEARRFGQMTCMFGKHEGKRYDQVPIDYLAWLADTQTKHARELRRYLNSDRIKRERETQDV